MPSLLADLIYVAIAGAAIARVGAALDFELYDTLIPLARWSWAVAFLGIPSVHVARGHLAAHRDQSISQPNVRRPCDTDHANMATQTMKNQRLEGYSQT